MEGGRVGSQNGDGLHTFSYPFYVALSRSQHGLLGPDRPVHRPSEPGRPATAARWSSAGWVAGNFFHVLGVKPHIGRVLTPEDDRPEWRRRVVVLQHDFWQARYAGRQDVVGSTIRLNGAPFTVVGVAAPEFGGTNAGLLTQMWAPVTARTALSPDLARRPEERALCVVLPVRPPEAAASRLAQAEAAMRVLHDQRKQEELQGEFFPKFPDTEGPLSPPDALARSGRSRALGAAADVRAPARRAAVAGRRRAAHRVHERGGAAARARRGAPA